MKLITYPDDKLRIKCQPVLKVTAELAKTAKEMYEVMIAEKGVGLSAPQVGLDFRLIVLDDHGSPVYMFNPVVLKKSTEQQVGGEGCLSFPDMFRIIKRPLEVIVKYRDINNKMRHEVYKGLLARAILHEIDHLNGVLFIDHEEKVKNDEKTTQG
jgi:peptide deformylase